MKMDKYEIVSDDIIKLKVDSYSLRTVLISLSLSTWMLFLVIVYSLSSPNAFNSGYEIFFIVSLFIYFTSSIVSYISQYLIYRDVQKEYGVVHELGDGTYLPEKANILFEVINNSKNESLVEYVQTLSKKRYICNKELNLVNSEYFKEQILNTERPNICD